MNCSRTQHRAPGEDRTRDLAIKSDALQTELSMLPTDQSDVFLGPSTILQLNLNSRHFRNAPLTKILISC